ncbi:MAG: ABC transporter ATP-binding protein [Bacteroidota bacterium]
MRHLRPLLKYFARYRWHLLGGILFVTISNLFGIFPAQLTRNALDLVAEQLGAYRLAQGFGLADQVYKNLMSSIFLFGLLVLIMAVLKGVFMFLMRQTIIVMSRHIEYDMKNEIYAQYQRLGPAFYNRNSTGDLMNRISEDVGRVRMVVGPAVMYAINMVVMFILVLWAMFSVNARLATYVLLPLPLLTFSIYWVHKRINRQSETVQRKLSELTTFAQESFSGIRLLKAFAAGGRYARTYAGLAEEYSEESMRLVRINAVFMPVMAWLVGISTILTVLIGGREAMAGRVTIGNIAEFVLYVNMLTWPVAALGWIISMVQRAAASQMRINEFMQEKPELVSGSMPIQHIKGDIRFEQVSYRYSSDRDYALQDISVNLPAGTLLGVIGKTGSGKSTFAQLLLRMMDPVEGKVLVDGADLRNLNLDMYRSRIGYVPQDTFLFSDSISANIAFGCKDGVNQEQVEQAARLAVVHDNIIGFPDQYETRIGERGITLSGGQKQRVSIARAIIRNPDLLIFDDCLSAVDTFTEASIFSNLRSLLKGRTGVFISHRVHTVQSCDHIVVLDKGRIAEQGSHAELVAAGGLYAQLLESQLKEEVGA